MKGIMVFLALAGSLMACAGKQQQKQQTGMTDTKNEQNSGNVHATAASNTQGTDTATFGQGCFWCAEAIFESMDGVISATSGYAGGTVESPTYKQVCTGTTGHAEVVQVVYDPKKVSYEDLLEAFWGSHDPTTLNRQGNDVGTQYRSVIFYHNDHQKELAEVYKKKLDDAGAFDKKIVTQIVPFTKFYPAEDYHQQYYEMNGEQPYCQLVIRPKLEKFRKVFKAKLKPSSN